MQRSFRSRLEALEAAQGGGVVVVRTSHDEHYRPLTAEERLRRLAAARQQVGPQGTVIELVYVHDWRPADA